MELKFWMEQALALGFAYAGPLDPATLIPREDVREMCRGDACRAYGRNWTCPPHCGTLAECGKRMAAFPRGILVQTVGTTEKQIDTRAWRRIEEEHLARFYRLCAFVRQRHPDALCLGTGGCRVCRQCAWPEPCRYPELALPSMEGYGLFVTQVCRDNGAEYHHGEKTVTYTACILLP